MKARLIKSRAARRPRPMWLLIAVSLALAACGPRHPAASSSAPDRDAGYAEPPRVLSAERVSGQVIIEGRAQPESRLRLVTPENEADGGTAGPDGAWAMPAPTTGGPQLYAVGEDLGGRVVRAEGAVVALPAGEPAAILRAGGGAVALGPPSTALRIAAVDYDGSGWAFVSGLAAPGAVVRLQVDQGAPADARADASGRFIFTLKPTELGTGRHRLLIGSGAASASAAIAVSPAGPLSEAPFQATHAPGAWRIDWRTPGGGVQTSLILDP